MHIEKTNDPLTEFIITAGKDKYIRKWDQEEPENYVKFKTNEGEILHMRLANDYLFTFGSDNMLVKYCLVKNEKI
jgi:WD40 repeat protein